MSTKRTSAATSARWLRTLVIAVLLVGALATPSSAVSLFAAYWDTSDLGEAGGLGLGFQFGGKFAIDIAGTYYEELDEDPLALVESGDSPFVGSGFEVIPIDVGVLWRSGAGRGTGLYLGAGATWFMIDTDATGVVTDDESGWYVKGGFDFAGGGRGPSMFVEALYRQVDTEVGVDFGFLEGGTERLSLDLNGVSFHLGVRF